MTHDDPTAGAAHTTLESGGVQAEGTTNPDKSDEWHRQEYARLIAENRARGLGEGPTNPDGIANALAADKRQERIEQESPPKRSEGPNAAQIVLALLFVAASAALITCSHGTVSTVSPDDIKGYRP